MAQARDQFGDIVDETCTVRGESDGAVAVDGAPGVEKPGQQVAALFLRRPQIRSGDVRTERHQRLGAPAFAFDAHVDVRIGRRATEPCTERERRNGQVGSGHPEGSSVDDGVIVVESGSELDGGTDSSVGGAPLMLGVGDEHRAVGEHDIEARAPVHDLGGRDDAGRRTVGVEQYVADRDLAHGGPPAGGGQGSIECECLTDTGTCSDDDHLRRAGRW